MKEMAVGGTGALIPWVPRGIEKAQIPLTTAKHKFFTTGEATALVAVCEQIVPRDEYPGAKESGVVDYIDSLLSGRMGRFYRANYRRGLAVLEDVSLKRHGKNFAVLSWNDQNAILRDFESGTANGPSGKKFFSLVVAHTMEGYYGDPSHGGNRGGTSWKMINFNG